MVREPEREGRGAGRADDVAHAARGPFAAALPALDMLLGGLLGDPTDMQREALQTVDRSVRRAFSDSRDLVTLLVALVVRFEPRQESWLIDEILADAVEAAALDPSHSAPVTVVGSVPPVLVDRAATVAVLAVLMRRHAASGQEATGQDAAERQAGQGKLTQNEQDVSACVEVRVEQAGEHADEVSIRIGRGPDSEEGGPSAVAPVGAPLLAVKQLLEKQGGRLRLAAGATTVWLPAAPSAARNLDRTDP